MSALLFKLRNVPEDEADDIRQLMDDNNIEYYETTAGNWGISMPAIWVQHDADLTKAKSLVSDYQQKRAAQARQAYNDMRASGTAPSWFSRFQAKPLATAGIILFCLFVLYVMISPFVRLAQHAG